MRRLPLLLAGSVWIAVLPLGAPDPALAEETSPRPRAIVRLSPSLAREAEAAFDAASGTVPRDAAAPALAGWLERHGARALVPVHGPRLAERRRRGLSEEALAESVRRRFPARARRWPRAFHPPDLSRSFVLVPDRLPRRELPALLEALRRDPEVEHAEEDKIVRPGEVEDEAPTGLPRIAAPAAGEAGEGVTVAVVDTGVDATHPDLAGSLWTNPGEVAKNGRDDDGNGYVDDARGWDFLGPRCLEPRPDDDPSDGHGHGTHVAGTVAARGAGGPGVVGVAPRARVMAVKGLDDSGSGLDSQLAAAIVYAADNGADVVNASWSGRGASEAIREAVDYAAELGVVVVAAAGNAGEDARGYYPAAFEPVIAVAASDASDAPAWFTNWGSRIDVAAPGVDVVSTRASGTSLGAPAGDGYVRLSGTSMAAPHVAGLAALVLARHPGFSTEEVRQAIRVSAIDIGRPGPDEESGHGRVDAPRAVEVERALAARILDPPDGATVRGTVAVSGLAEGPGLARYELAVGAGESPSAWTTLAEASSPAAGGALGTFDASQVKDGLYTLRLTATDGTGRAFDDRRQVIVDEVRFDAPPPPRSPAAATVVRPGVPVALEGRADGPSFLRYRLLWAPGLHPPSGWTEGGLALEAGGLRPVDGGRLATWEPPAGARAGYYSFRLLVDNEAGFTSEARTALYLEPDLLAGQWPRPVRPGPWKGNGAHAVTGAAGEPLLALTSPLDAGGTRLWRFDASGSSADVTDDAGALDLAALHPIATAPLDARPGDEVLVAHPRLLRAWGADGSSWTFPAPPGHGLVRAVPVIEELDGAPGLEVLAVATSFRAGTGRLQAWRADGTSVGGAFPVEVPDRNLGVSNEGRQRLLVADVDGDGGKEIVLADGPAADAFSLRLLGPDGTRRPWADPVFDGSPAALAAADLDGDSALEVLVLAVRDLAPVLHVLDALGQEKAGWPVALGAGAPSLAVADLDRDGRAEVVVSAGHELHVLDATGLAFAGAWPRTGAAYFGPPVVGDVDGDGRPEIVVAALRAARIAAPPWPREAGARVGPSAAWVPPGLAPEDGGDPPARSVGYHDYELLAFRADGSLARSWRLHGAGGRETAGLPVPLLADVDGDSRTDVAVVQPLAEPGASEVDEALLTVLATGAPHDEDAPDWPAVRRDGRNSAVLPVVRPRTDGPPAP